MAKGGAPKVARYRFDGLDAATHDEVVWRAVVSFSNVPGITCSRESHDRVVVQRTRPLDAGGVSGRPGCDRTGRAVTIPVPITPDGKRGTTPLPSLIGGAPMPRRPRVSTGSREPNVTPWSSEELSRIGQAEELQVAAARPDGTMRSHVTIWVVRIGDDLYIRSAYGPNNPWYVRAKASGVGRIRAGGARVQGRRVRPRPTALAMRRRKRSKSKTNRVEPSPN
jgi:hypothetical protein